MLAHKEAPQQFTLLPSADSLSEKLIAALGILVPRPSYNHTSARLRKTSVEALAGLITTLHAANWRRFDIV